MNLKPFSLAEAKADPSRVIQRSGRPVRHLVFDMNSTHPIGGLMTADGGNEAWCQWTKNGRLVDDCEFPEDLMLKQEIAKVTIWRNRHGNLLAGINLGEIEAARMRRDFCDLVGEGDIPLKDASIL